jgi:osmotically-inducible protein OsmY
MKRILTLLLMVCLVAGASMSADPLSDDEIYDKVRINLANDRDVKGGHIEVVVSKGVVELRGNVKLEKQRVKAEKIAKKVKGVQRVVNNLKVAPL